MTTLSEERNMNPVREYANKTVFLNPFSSEIWESTYKDHKDTCIDDTFYRVAEAIASVENTPELQALWTHNFFEMLQNFLVTVGGRIYSNAGTEWKGTTLMNCFVGPQPKGDVDSLAGILELLEGQAKTLKAEGGWGNNFSTLRPRGAFIHGIGVESPGAVKYMELFDKSSEIVTSGSGKKSTNSKAKGKIRKGAQMGVIDIWHPDVIEFITAKQAAGRLSKFNMSVNVSDEFMERLEKVNKLDAFIDRGVPGYEEHGSEIGEAVENFDKWDLIFPETTHPKYKKEWDGNIKKWKAKGYPVNVYQTVSVKWLWNLIMESTYNRAEPGVLFLDRANDFNPLYYGETITSTNPCVTGDTLVLTDKGSMTMKALCDRIKSGERIMATTLNVKTNQPEYEDIVFADKTRENANVIELELDDGSTLKLTPDHKVFTENRGYVKASQLNEDDILILTDETKMNEFNDLGITERCVAEVLTVANTVYANCCPPLNQCLTSHTYNYGAEIDKIISERESEFVQRKGAISQSEITLYRTKFIRLLLDREQEVKRSITEDDRLAKLNVPIYCNVLHYAMSKYLKK